MNNMRFDTSRIETVIQLIDRDNNEKLDFTELIHMIYVL